MRGRQDKQNKIERFEVRLAGTGGQGIILAGIILAEAAAIGAGKNVAQTQSYGPEARGGASKAEVIIADGEIDYPKVIRADLLLALSQEACDRYGREVKPDGWLIVDAGLVRRVPPHSHTVAVPITDIALEKTGRRITANIVGLGIIAGLTDVLSKETITQAVERRAPAGTLELNRQALEAGLLVANGVKKKHA